MLEKFGVLAVQHKFLHKQKNSFIAAEDAPVTTSTISTLSRHPDHPLRSPRGGSPRGEHLTDYVGVKEMEENG